jgi:two-component system, LuxR family, sensor kinase FixL
MASTELPIAHKAEPSPWVVGLSYVAAFLLLDWVSYIRPFEGLNITPWNPQPALAIALLLRQPRWLWLVWLSLLTAELAVRGVPADWFVTLAATGALALSYAAIARALNVRLRPGLSLDTRRELLWFTAIVIPGTLLSAAVYVTSLVVGGVTSTSPLYEPIIRYWIGDAVGVVVLLPILLCLLHPQRRAALLLAARNKEWWAIVLVTLALLAVVFGQDDKDHFKFFYLLFLPVVWASARLGLSGAVLVSALTQVGLIVAVQSLPNPDLSVFELQVLMAAAATTGLTLGVAVDERERASAELKGSLRLAAAGQMAAALAHELSQPLTALNSYAQAAELLVTSTDMPDAERVAALADVSRRMASDALRASDVVKRLRDFFRSGDTQLENVDLSQLLDDAMVASSKRAKTVGVSVERDASNGLPLVFADPVQLAVVLRNLLANALDAASVGSNGHVFLTARQVDDVVRIDVADSGPGVDAARLQTLFEPGSSDKPGGMGVGLSICRAIVEAHGGSLWAESGASGRFCFTLPIARQGELHAP